MDTVVGRQAIIANNKTSSKITWKRKEGIQMALAIREWFEDRGYNLPSNHRVIFGRKFIVGETTNYLVALEVKRIMEADRDNHLERYRNYVQSIKSRPVATKPQSLEEFTQRVAAKLKVQKLKDLRREHAGGIADKAMRFFTDRETGECFHDEYVELARAYYTLRNSSPAVYALFKSKHSDHYLKQLVAMACTSHRLDPVWNYKKSKLIRGLWFRFLQETRIYEDYQPMHLMLTVPHKNGVWNGERFYGREFIKKFNLMRKTTAWNNMIYGGEYGLEVTRTGKSGLHIHMHCLVFQKKHLKRDVVDREIRLMWHELTGAEVTWYETLYVHKKDESGKFIMECSDDGIPIIEKTGQWTDESKNYTIETEGIRGKKKKFYLDDREPWFAALSPNDKLKHYCDGVMECIKYHFKTDCFKKKGGGWDVDLMKDVLQHSRNLRMYSKFGAFYREKALNYSRLEEARVITGDETPIIAAGVDPESDGVLGRVNNPYTGTPAEQGQYAIVLALPEQMLHARDKHGKVRAPVSNKIHDVYFKIKPGKPIREVISAIMTGENHLKEVLVFEDFERYRRWGWRAPRGEAVWV